MEQFWTRSSINKNKAMEEHLQHYGVISFKKVVEVMETMGRALCVPKRAQAYVDSPMPIGYNATISAPHMHATCLQLLEEHLKPGMHALDVRGIWQHAWPLWLDHKVVLLVWSIFQNRLLRLSRVSRKVQLLHFYRNVLSVHVEGMLLKLLFDMFL